MKYFLVIGFLLLTLEVSAISPVYCDQRFPVLKEGAWQIKPISDLNDSYTGFIYSLDEQAQAVTISSNVTTNRLPESKVVDFDDFSFHSERSGSCVYWIGYAK